MKLILLCLLLFFITKSYSQKPSDIIGLWHVVVMDNGVRYDYKTGKYTVSKALQDSLAKHKGSAFNREDYINWAGSCADCYYEFTPDGEYLEYRDTILRTVGTFKFSLKDSIIKVIVKAGNKNISKDYKCYFIKKRLFLSVPSYWTLENMKLELERLK